MIEAVQHLDFALFQVINQELANPVMDYLLPILRDKKTWIPVYVLIVALAFFKLGWKGLLLVLCCTITVGIGDFVSSKVIKPSIERDRPCRNIDYQQYNQGETARLLVNCGGGHSFTSSHATNHFGLSVFLIFAFARKRIWLKYLLLFWALAVSFSQAYVGVHFPFDLLAGALLGSSIGYFTAKMYRWVGKKLFATSIA